MKKTILIAFLLGCLTTFASAEMKAGISITGYDLDADGKESNINPTEGDKSESADIMGVTASVFIEYEVMDMLSVGLDVVPYAIDMGSVKNVRNATAMSPSGTKGSDGQDGTNSAQVDLDYNATAYVLIPTEQGIYLKAGVSYGELAISETLTTGTSYPDEELIGFHANIGYEHDLGGAFVRAEAGYSDWDTVKVKSSSGRNTVTADLDGVSARISIGKAF